MASLLPCTSTSRNILLFQINWNILIVSLLLLIYYLKHWKILAFWAIIYLLCNPQIVSNILVKTKYGLKRICLAITMKLELKFVNTSQTVITKGLKPIFYKHLTKIIKAKWWPKISISRKYLRKFPNIFILNKSIWLRALV